MAAQPDVDFTEYTTVSPEYVYVNGLFVPFYAIYKDLGKNKSGMHVYAKTYVPAVEPEGLEEYFNMRTAMHPLNPKS
ncbi:MAG: hypothetical protein ACI3XR_01705 [Eubacteriales bacterium]